MTIEAHDGLTVIRRFEFEMLSEEITFIFVFQERERFDVKGGFKKFLIVKIMLVEAPFPFERQP